MKAGAEDVAAKGEQKAGAIGEKARDLKEWARGRVGCFGESRISVLGDNWRRDSRKC